MTVSISTDCPERLAGHVRELEGDQCHKCGAHMKAVAEELHEAGYGYRPSRMVGRREVYRLSDGLVIGQFTAWDAVQFLERLS